uniref:Uncharacterized protein n=1 Tax=Taeniopygia guttata TaxID=59729 RepID=A0A674GNW7_TAEGU
MIQRAGGLELLSLQPTLRHCCRTPILGATTELGWLHTPKDLREHGDLRGGTGRRGTPQSPEEPLEKRTAPQGCCHCCCTRGISCCQTQHNKFWTFIRGNTCSDH